MLSLRDVMKAQPKRGRVASGDGRRGGGGGGNRQPRKKPPPGSSKKKKGIAIRPGASIAAASRSQSRQIYELDDDDDDDSSCSSVEVRYQNPKQHYKPTAQTKSRTKRDYDEDDESSKESDEEDEIPYKMNFSQLPKENHNDVDRDSSDSDSDANGYGSPLSEDEQPSTAAAEPLRPGDVIEYENTMIFVAGSGMGRHTAKVLGTNPKSKFPLKLSTGDHLEGDVRVCRTHEWIQGKLYKHAGYWKPIRSFRMRKRTLRNPDGTPVEVTGGAVGVAKTWKNQRDGLHQKAVEFLRGDHDDRLRSMGRTQGNRSVNKATENKGSSNWKAAKDDDNDSSSSDSSDASELMKLEFERLQKERKQKLQQERENNPRNKSSLPQSSVRKSPPLLLSEDSDSNDNESNTMRRTTPLPVSKPLSLVLKKIPRTSLSSLPEKDSDDDSLETQEELRRVKATNRAREKTIPSNTPKKPIEISIDIDSKPKRQTPENIRRSNHNSPPSSSSSAAKQAGRKSLTQKKRTFAMTTVASKVEDAKRSEEWLNEDSDSSSDGDDSLLGKPIFASKNSPAKQPTIERPPTSAAQNKAISSSREPQTHSPMEENPIDLFEDSSGDDDSSGASACRKRNRRGERVLRSPNFDLQYRKSRHGKENNKDSPLLFTQEGGKGVTKEELSASPRRAVKRSVVVGYRPLSISVNGTQRAPDEGHQDDSPPSLAKAYRKFDAKKQRERDEERRRTALKQTVGMDDSWDRKGKKQKLKKKKERKDSNKQYLQREKKRLQQEGARPPPYPRPRSEYQPADMSTQENEWTDCELLDDAESTRQHPKIRRNHVRKRAKPTVATAKKTTQSFFLDSELSPPKRSRSSSKKQKPTKSWNSSIDDSEEEPQHRRKKLTPKSSKSRNRNRNRSNHQRYELSPSSSSEGDEPNMPSTPWSTDCEVNSPPPSAIAVVRGGAHRNATATPKGSAQSFRSSNHSHRKRKSSDHRRTNSKPSVFEFLSQDSNENPSALEGCVTKRNLSPTLLNSSKRKTSKPKSARKRRNK